MVITIIIVLWEFTALSAITVETGFCTVTTFQRRCTFENHVSKRKVPSISFPTVTLLEKRKDEMEGDSGKNLEGVVELGAVDVKPMATSPLAPFLSQGDIDPQALNPDLSDPKQTRVIIYIILSLIPVLFLIPLMLGSRELIPLESLPPVPM